MTTQVGLRERPEQAGLFALCRPTQDGDRIRQVTAALTDPGLRWGNVLELAVDHKLVCLLAEFLHTNAPDLPGTAMPGTSMMRHLHSTWRANQHKIVVYRRAAAQIAEHAAGLRWAAHSGIAWESTLYDLTGARALSDLDLFIHPADHGRMTAVLTALGFQQAEPDHFTCQTGELVLPTVHLDLASTPEHATGQPGIGDLLTRRITQPIPGHIPRLPVLDHGDSYRLALLDLALRPPAQPSLSDGTNMIKFADAARLRHRVPDAVLDRPGWDPTGLQRGIQQLHHAVLSARTHKDTG